MSASRMPVRAPSWARARARLTAVVDLPTPPLPEATAIMFLTLCMLGRPWPEPWAAISQPTLTSAPLTPGTASRVRVSSCPRASRRLATGHPSTTFARPPPPSPTTSPSPPRTPRPPASSLARPGALNWRRACASWERDGELMSTPPNRVRRWLGTTAPAAAMDHGRGKQPWQPPPRDPVRGETHGENRYTSELCSIPQPAASGPPDYARSSIRSTAPHPGDQRPALCQWPPPSGPSAGDHPDRHLGALSANAGERVHLCLRRRCPRHRHHADRGTAGADPRTADRRGQGRSRAGLCRLPHQARQLLHPPLRGMPPLLRADLSATAGQRPHCRAHRHPALRPRAGAVPGRSLRQGDLPPLPCR